MSAARRSAQPRGEQVAGLPVIAIIGRPNAGKSTLFNRLTKTQRALVDPEPGVTRDRNVAEVDYLNRRFLLVDTGGFDASATEGIAAEVRAQSEAALEEADAVIFLLDGRAGVSPADRDVVDRLRRAAKPVWVAVNKLDTPSLDDDAVDFFSLGVEHIVPISAAHGRGVADLMEQVLSAVGEIPEEVEVRPESTAIAVAIVGRPNVGKSSLLNRLVGYERSIVTAIPGTTRDAVDTPLTLGEQAFVLVDTAGIRRRPKVQEHIERGSVVRAFRALERADVAVLVVDAVEGMTEQDARIAGYAWERGRALIVAVNKCDVAGGRRHVAATIAPELQEQYPFLHDVPVLSISAQTGAGVSEVLPTVALVSANHRREMQTARLNQVITEAVRATAPPSQRGKRPTFQYAVQTARCPPTISIFCSRPELVTTAYTRFLVHQLRHAFELTGTPVRLTYRARSRTERRAKPKGPKGKVTA